ncbi:slipin family protein, partial [Streptomyces spectabilis]
LRLLQTVVAVAAEKNSTLVLPFPVELLRFLERAQAGPGPGSSDAGRPAPSAAPPESGVESSTIGPAAPSGTAEASESRQD